MNGMKTGKQAFQCCMARYPKAATVSYHDGKTLVPAITEGNSFLVWLVLECAVVQPAEFTQPSWVKNNRGIKSSPKNNEP